MQLPKFFLQRMKLGCARRQSFDGFQLAPLACTANSRHERTGSPLNRIVQAPHTPCSQPTWVPVSPRSSRRKSVKSLRGSTSPRVLAAVDRQAHLSILHREGPRTDTAARSAAWTRARRANASQALRRYSALAWMSASCSMFSVARRAASMKAALMASLPSEIPLMRRAGSGFAPVRVSRAWRIFPSASKAMTAAAPANAKSP